MSAMLSGAAAAQNRRKIPPPVPLVPDKPKTVLAKGSYLSMELLSSPGVDGSSKFKKDVAFFKDGTPEEYLDWHDNLMLVLDYIQVKSTSMASTLLIVLHNIKQIKYKKQIMLLIWFVLG